MPPAIFSSMVTKETVSHGMAQPQARRRIAPTLLARSHALPASGGSSSHSDLFFTIPSAGPQPSDPRLPGRRLYWDLSQSNAVSWNKVRHTQCCQNPLRVSSYSLAIPGLNATVTSSNLFEVQLLKSHGLAKERKKRSVPEGPQVEAGLPSGAPHPPDLVRATVQPSPSVPLSVCLF